ncbi:hypothetical protein F5Y07DRAFT_397056 [Xylaria sp. FL0933]|nr:hypothetical protein F5Y07DRAFT_397056 [Xylaria sp. FL0933]
MSDQVLYPTQNQESPPTPSSSPQPFFQRSAAVSPSSRGASDSPTSLDGEHTTWYPPLQSSYVEALEDNRQSCVLSFPTGEEFSECVRQRRNITTRSTRQPWSNSTLDPCAPSFTPGSFSHYLSLANYQLNGSPASTSTLKASPDERSSQPEIQTPDDSVPEANGLRVHSSDAGFFVRGKVPLYREYYLERKDIDRDLIEEDGLKVRDDYYETPADFSCLHLSDMPRWPLSSFPAPIQGQFHTKLYPPGWPVTAIHSIFTDGEEIGEVPAVRLLKNSTGTQLEGFLFVSSDRFTFCGLSHAFMRANFARLPADITDGYSASRS